MYMRAAVSTTSLLVSSEIVSLSSHVFKIVFAATVETIERVESSESGRMFPRVKAEMPLKRVSALEIKKMVIHSLTFPIA